MKIVILTCKDNPYPVRGEEIIGQTLEKNGHEVVTLPWDEVKATDDYDLFVFRTVWDYMDRVEEFEAWFQTLEKEKVRSINSIECVRWNLNKKYMLELKEAGVSIPRTFIHDRQWLPNWDKLEAALGSPPFVFKPLTGAGGKETFLVQGDVSYSAAIDRLNKRHFIAQNFIKEVKQGEISAMVIGGEYSHAVKKVPQGGEFRVQSNYGGTVEAIDLDTKLQEWAVDVVKEAPHPPIIARVDFVLVNDEPVLMELELFEPEMFFDHKPEAAEKIANLMLKNNS